MTRSEWHAIVAALQAAGHDEVAILASWQRARAAGVTRRDTAEVVRAAVAARLLATRAPVTIRAEKPGN